MSFLVQKGVWYKFDEEETSIFVGKSGRHGYVDFECQVRGETVLEFGLETMKFVQFLFYLCGV
jgi:hypothetical protein